MHSVNSVACVEIETEHTVTATILSHLLISHININGLLISIHFGVKLLDLVNNSIDQVGMLSSCLLCEFETHSDHEIFQNKISYSETKL